jgi:hypothetical protein
MLYEINYPKIKVLQLTHLLTLILDVHSVDPTVRTSLYSAFIPNCPSPFYEAIKHCTVIPHVKFTVFIPEAFSELHMGNFSFTTFLCLTEKMWFLFFRIDITDVLAKVIWTTTANIL